MKKYLFRVILSAAIKNCRNFSFLQFLSTMWKNLALMGLVVGFFACGDDSNSTSVPSENSAQSSAVEDDESSSSINGDSSSSVIPVSSSSVILSDSEGSSSSSSVKVNGKSSSSSKKGGSSSSEFVYRLCEENEHKVVISALDTGYVTCKNNQWVIDSIVEAVLPKVYPDMDSVFGSKATYGTFTDPRDGKVYRTVKSFDMDGNYSFTVMAQNLNYADVMIDSTTTVFDDGKVEKLCYKDDPWYCDNYFGALYSWSEAMGLPKVCDSIGVADNPKCTANFNDEYPEDSKVQGVCPEGWHVMNETEWKHVAKTPAGIDLSHSLLSQAVWSHKIAAKNSYGMSILPYGDEGAYKELALFWVPAEISISGAKLVDLSMSRFTLSKISKHNYEYVRCVLDY